MKKYILPTVVVACLILGFITGHTFFNAANAQRFYFQNGRLIAEPGSKIDQLLMLMSQGYVDEIDMDSIEEEVMKDLVQKLDPHSAYITKEDLEMVNSELSSSFSGIGVQFTIQNDTVNFVAIISGGPCDGLGLLAGDKLVEVDDSLFVGKKLTNEKVMHTLRGSKDTQVKLGVRRNGCKDILRFTVTRGDIPVNSVDAQFIIEGENQQKIGFVRVNKFGESTYNEFITALAQLRDKGARSYIIDLRENSGGFMEQAIEMANEFLERGDLIVYSEGRVYPKFEARANGTGNFKQVPLVVLIDDFSASASEIFAGAMQDNDRATIIGRRSFGKGLVQQQFELGDGSAIRMTVARYYTPSGRCIQKPYKLGDQTDYQMEMLERYNRGEFFSQDSIQYTDTTLYYTRKGRIVHGGGGIMPDIFVGTDTTLNTPYYNQVANLAYTYQFALEYTNAHRQQLSRNQTWQSLEQYLIKANWMPAFVAFCKKKGIEPNEAQINKSRPLLTRLINAYIVRNILGDEGFFPLFERDDQTTQRAITELSK